MKKIVLFIFSLLMTTAWTEAQITTPSLSPSAKVEQRIGLTDVVVEYSRPSKRERVIYGDLVPYDTPWRTGANAATKITFSDTVNVGGVNVPKGSYALITKPGMKTWTFMLYPHNSTNWGSYLESDVKPFTFTAEAAKMPEGISVETLMMGFDNLHFSGGDFFILWDNVYVGVPIKTNTEQAVEASISKVMAGPGASDYYNAASYYLSNKKDLNKALEWVNKSIAMGNERFWVYRTKALIQAELGDKAGAIASANKSTELAREAKNDEFVKMNEASIMEWRK